MKIELDINIPEGYEATGEYRMGKSGDYVISQFGEVAHLSSDCWIPRIILRPKKRKVVKFVEDTNGDYVMVGAYGTLRYDPDRLRGATRYSIETTE